MKELLVYVYVAVMAMLFMYMAVLAIEAKPKSQLNCGIAEVSPDYTHADRQKCRLIRANRI